MHIIILLVILLLVFGIGGPVYGGPRWGGGFAWGSGGIGIILAVVLIFLLLGRI